MERLRKELIKEEDEEDNKRLEGGEMREKMEEEAERQDGELGGSMGKVGIKYHVFPPSQFH